MDKNVRPLSSTPNRMRGNSKQAAQITRADRREKDASTPTASRRFFKKKGHTGRNRDKGGERGASWKNPEPLTILGQNARFFCNGKFLVYTVVQFGGGCCAP
jgi:hypothetical protein